MTVPEGHPQFRTELKTAAYWPSETYHRAMLLEPGHLSKRERVILLRFRVKIEKLNLGLVSGLDVHE
jgi:hypothetical protein